MLSSADERKRVSRGWHSHIESYSGTNNNWQHNLRGDLRAWWQTFYHRATAIVRNDRDPRPSAQREEMATLLKDLCTTLETHSYSRALTGGVAVIILIPTRPNTNFRETLGHLYPRTPNPFKQERILLQSLLSAGILRHGLAPTPGTPAEQGLDTSHTTSRTKDTLTSYLACRNTDFRTT